jgi:hypothetical protein
VAVVPTESHTVASRSGPRSYISKPRYHRKKQSSEPPDTVPPRPSIFSCVINQGSGTGDGSLSPKATEQTFVVQYPVYARDLEKLTIEKKLSRHARRRAAAANRWDRDVIPALIRPYMEYMRKSERGQAHIDPPSTQCSCSGRGISKQVTAVHMDRTYVCCAVLDQKLITIDVGLDYIELRICSCSPAPVQLVKRGLFPCSPVYPALAVSIEMLEFVSMLFVHLAPNETAWAEALVMFLARRGHVFEAQDSFRRRFASALGQFQVLIRVVNAEMDKQISVARCEVLSHDPIDRDDIVTAGVVALPGVDESTPIAARSYTSALSTSPMTDLPTTSTSDCPTIPSEYLRSRCPLCFGGINEAGDSKL